MNTSFTVITNEDDSDILWRLSEQSLFVNEFILILALELNKPPLPPQNLFHFAAAHIVWGSYRGAGSMYPNWNQQRLEPKEQQKQINNHLFTSDIIASSSCYYCEKMKNTNTVVSRDNGQ